MTIPRRWSVLFIPLVASALLSGAPASGQCFGPDGLDLGPCCAPTIPTLPPFPAASLPGLGICWGQCTVTSTRVLKVTWATPAAPNCADYTTPITVTDGISGLPILVGKMQLDYTRTWIEIDPSGTATQVWRFTAKADLSPVPGAGPPPCPVPNCLTIHPTAFYYGYCDYSTCSTAGLWENALVLYHAADRFIHAPGLSDRPGAFHPSGSFAIVAPHSAVQPFIPSNLPAPGGPLLAEATRDMFLPGVPPAFCVFEDRVTQGAITKLGAGCLNTMSANPKQQTARDFKGATGCITPSGVPGGWASLNIGFPGLPWLHMVTTSIGTWSNPGIYPGKEFAWVDEGLFVQQDACLGDVIELKYGGSTSGGWTPLLPIPITTFNFTDIADNYTAPLGGPYPTPILGSIRPTDRLIYVNIP